MTGIVYAVVAGGLLSSPRLLRGLLQLDEVSLDALPFAPPNPSVPQSLRGLWWIDNGAGAVTVDLNRLRRDRRGQGFHVDDAAKNYQSVSNNLSGLRFWLLSALAGIRSHMPGDGTVTWSVLWARCRAVRGPERQARRHEVSEHTSAAARTLRVLPHLTTFSTYRIVDAAGEKTPHYAKMLSAMRAASSGPVRPSRADARHCSLISLRSRPERHGGSEAGLVRNRWARGAIPPEGARSTSARATGSRARRARVRRRGALVPPEITRNNSRSRRSPPSGQQRHEQELPTPQTQLDGISSSADRKPLQGQREHARRATRQARQRAAVNRHAAAYRCSSRRTVASEKRASGCSP